VAPGFEGATSRDTALGKECVDNGITPITVRDFALLVQVAPMRQIGWSQLRQLFESCRTPQESHEWIRALVDHTSERPPTRQVLEVIAREMADSRDPIRISAIATRLRLEEKIELRELQVTEVVESLRRLAPGYISFDGATVALETTVEKVLGEIEQQQSKLPEEIIRKGYIVPIDDE
jgi:hypothetical protein